MAYVKAKKGPSWTKAGWHPAAGKWGIFGETAGSKSAKRAKSLISGQISDVQGRKAGLTEYFEGLKGLTEEEKILASQGRDVELSKGRTARKASELGHLSSLENFLNESYSISSESDSRIGKADFATLSDPQAEFQKRLRRSKVGSAEDMQRLRDESMGQDITSGDLGYRKTQLGFKRGELQLGMEETKAMQAIQDQLFQLQEALGEYT
tara:strand:+ start:24 stop:650 length:627 start_codon:yes stop_codon:yes gene_type:complete